MFNIVVCMCFMLVLIYALFMVLGFVLNVCAVVFVVECCLLYCRVILSYLRCV